jgi:ABC-type multidrug transport system fused ATPase/permease subunit
MISGETLRQLRSFVDARFFAALLLRIVPIVALDLIALLLIRLFFLRVYVEAGGEAPASAVMHGSAFVAGGVLIAFLAFRLAAGFLVSRSVFALVLDQQQRLVTRLFGNYLGQPYRAQREASRSEQRQTLFIASTALVQQMLLPLVHLIVDGSVALAILIVLIVKEPVATLVLVVWLGLLLAAQAAASAPASRRAGAARWDALNRMRMIADAALGDPRLTKLSASEDALTRRFREQADRHGRAVAAENALLNLPAYARELVLVSAVCVLIGVLALEDRGGYALIGALALFAAASVRLLPALQRSVVFVQKLGTHASDLAKTHADREIEREQLDAGGAAGTPLIRESVQLRGVTFGYVPDSPLIENVDLTIARGERVLITGPSGTGKSTLILLACGLVRPDRGVVEIDGDADHLLARIRRGRVALVPHDPFVGNLSILENIAFPGEADAIDRERAAALLEALKLNLSLDDPAGEHGARLSGGERQRVALARAIYRHPELLILDEATSQLDVATEAAVFRCVAEACADATILAISHRPPPSGLFDRRFVLANGRLEAISDA